MCQTFNQIYLPGKKKFSVAPRSYGLGRPDLVKLKRSRDRQGELVKTRQGVRSQNGARARRPRAGEVRGLEQGKRGVRGWKQAEAEEQVSIRKERKAH
jgi:hypothetical protein